MLNLEDLIRLGHPYSPDFDTQVRSFDLGTRHFAFDGTPKIMGVINLSAQSWYRESVCLTAESAIHRGLRLKAEGADLIDLGCESTLSHTDLVDEVKQIESLVPVVQALAEQQVIVSVETYHTKVAHDCLKAGAQVINWTGDLNRKDVFRSVAEFKAGIILCYVPGDDVRHVGDFPLDDDPIPGMYEYFSKRTEEAEKQGVSRIFIDPGLGFYYRNLQDGAIRVRHQMKTFLHTFRLRKLGWPVCHALPHAFDYFRDEIRSAEPFFAVWATLGKTDLLRTHEVSKVRGVLGTMGTWKSS